MQTVKTSSDLFNNAESWTFKWLTEQCRQTFQSIIQQCRQSDLPVTYSTMQTVRPSSDLFNNANSHTFQWLIQQCKQSDLPVTYWTMQTDLPVTYSTMQTLSSDLFNHAHSQTSKWLIQQCKHFLVTYSTMQTLSSDLFNNANTFQWLIQQCKHFPVTYSKTGLLSDLCSNSVRLFSDLSPQGKLLGFNDVFNNSCTQDSPVTSPLPMHHYQQVNSRPLPLLIRHTASSHLATRCIISARSRLFTLAFKKDVWTFYEQNLNQLLHEIMDIWARHVMKAWTGQSDFSVTSVNSAQTVELLNDVFRWTFPQHHL